ncbi:FecCD family ABC transporter permease [Leucobacter chromiireducens]|uniref:Fe(3+)-siderophore ABC transporter permease n=1 Tax=Leucobacter chromiireducens subsp. solipictus TaxID=398235 RepID=A0ABS1SHQ4_9MICO|nr:iron chelate uptake ABC transporter family permease subunit [Leucobacter chromiireducens]MBL3679562.1 Fe(3+)-siderophore ABC transporter permease [Leucobacter chromiireducens subsp. solipictus]
MTTTARPPSPPSGITGRTPGARTPPAASDRTPEPRPGLARGTGARLAWLGVAVVALVGVAVVSVVVGARDLPLSTVWEAVFAPRDTETHYVVWDLRIPRTLVAVVVGAALGVAGALVQALTRNPLADPGILGVNSGAAFAVTVGVGVLGVSSVSGTLWFAFGGALIVTIAVYAIGAAGRGGADPLRLVLAGVALGAVLSGAMSTLTLLDPSAFDKMRNWGAGSVVGRELAQLWPVIPFIAAGLVLAACMAHALNAIALGEDLAAALGANVLRTRIIVIIAVTLLAGGATAIAGPIGFIGLMVPHVARWIVGPDQRWILAFTLVLAPILLLLSDIAGRILMRPAEIPVGIVTAFIGAPVLIVLIRRRRVSQL